MKHPEMSYENNPNWKGNSVGNKGLHQWVRRNIGRPKICETCGTGGTNIQLANKTGIYDRNFENWFYLCPKCHINYDKLWLIRKDDYFKKGYKKTPEHLANLGQSLRGRKVWNKGTKGMSKANSGTFKKGVEHSEFMKQLWKKRKSL